MDDFWSGIAESIGGAVDRGINAAVDVAIFKETGVRSGPTWTPNMQQPTRPLNPGAGLPSSGLPSWVLPAALALVAGVVVVRMMRKS